MHLIVIRKPIDWNLGIHYFKISSLQGWKPIDCNLIGLQRFGPPLLLQMSADVVRKPGADLEYSAGGRAHTLKI
ncbi:hypothetical protein HanPI659440_Chr12g0459231 [Helianthus annuus]|nr:hypothetical protein HanIR_Chr12g0582151 [Helianthus annuus]KAJ0725482.1 hypothetical protein HanPI659440_Chr12g0459231 [Helianthus annuus]